MDQEAVNDLEEALDQIKLNEKNLPRWAQSEVQSEDFSQAVDKKPKAPANPASGGASPSMEKLFEQNLRRVSEKEEVKGANDTGNYKVDLLEGKTLFRLEPTSQLLGCG